MTTGQEHHGDSHERLAADLLLRLWKGARRPHDILRAGLVERGLDRAFDDLNKSIRDARLQQRQAKAQVFDRFLARRWEEDKERLAEELIDLIRAFIDDGLYIVLIKTDAGLVLLEPERRKIAVFGYEHDWVRVGDKVFHDVRLAPAWLVNASDLRLLAGAVTASSLKEARKRIDRSGLIRSKRRAASSRWMPYAANDDFLVPPSRQPKRQPPNYSAVSLPAEGRRPGPEITWLEHQSLMEKRAKENMLEPKLAREVRKLIEIGLALKFRHRPAIKTLMNALGRRYRELLPRKPSQY